jgi:hypothetical protein
MLVSKGNTEYMSGSRNKEVSPSEAHGNYESQKKKKKSILRRNFSTIIPTIFS